MVGDAATFTMITRPDDADLDSHPVGSIKKIIQRLIAANSDMNEEKKNKVEHFL